VGLVETSLALTVGILLVGAAVGVVQKNRDRAHAVELASEEQLIFKAADEYYRSACRSGTLPAGVTMATLQSQGYLPRAPRDPWGASWSVTYLNAPKRAQVSAALPGAPLGLVSWIQGYVGAYTFSGATVSWVHNIRIAADTTSATNASEFLSMYGGSSC